MLRRIDKQSWEFVESVLKKKRKDTMGRICRKGRFKPGDSFSVAKERGEIQTGHSNGGTICRWGR